MLPEPCQVRVWMSLSEIGGRPLNSGYAFARNDRKGREVELVDQIVQQQLIPENPARQDQDVSAGLLFERGDLRGRVGHFDDARIVPRS